MSVLTSCFAALSRWLGSAGPPTKDRCDADRHILRMWAALRLPRTESVLTVMRRQASENASKSSDRLVLTARARTICVELTPTGISADSAVGHTMLHSVSHGPR